MKWFRLFMKRRKGIRGRKRRLLMRMVLYAVTAAGLGAIIFALGAALSFRIFVTPEILRERMLAQLRKTFDRPVSIKHVTVVFHQGIKISGLEVGESDAFPGEKFLSSEFLIAKYRFLPLLLGRLELDSVVLTAPHIRLTRREDGRWNIQDALRSPRDRKAERSRFSLPPLHSAETIIIERGRVELLDDVRHYDIVFKDLQLRADELNLEGRPFTLESSFEGSGRVSGRGVRSRLRLSGALWADLRGRGAAGARSLRLKVDDRDFTVRLDVRDFSQPRVDLVLRLPELDSAFLQRFHAAPSGIDLPASRWELRAEPVKLKSGPGVAVSTAPLPYKISSLSVRSGDMALKSTGRFDARNGWFRLWVGADGFPLEEASAVYESWKKRRIAGTASGSLTFTGDWRHPVLESLSLRLKEFSATIKGDRRFTKTDFRISGRDRLRTISVRVPQGTYTFYGNALSDLDLDLQLRGGDMAVRKFHAVWNDSRFKLHGCFKDIARLGKVYFDGEVDKLRVDQTYSAVENLIVLRKKEKGLPIEEGRPWAHVFRLAIPDRFPDLAGHLRVPQAYSPNFNTQSLDVRVDLRDISKGLGDVSGSFRIGFGPARVNNADRVRKAHPLLNVLILPFSFMQEMEAKARGSFDTAVLRTLDINRTYGDFSVRKGLLDVRYVSFDSPQFMSYCDGKVDWPTEEVALHVLMRATKPRGQLPFTLVDTAGRPALDLHIIKDLNSPEAELTHRKMKATDIEDALAAGLQRATSMPTVSEDDLACKGGS